MWKIITIVLIVSHITAQDVLIPFENISTLSGLSALRTKSLFQDSEGYLWIGTMNAGLNRYNGYRFTTYKHNTEDSTSLIHNNVYSIAEDKNGDLWIATNNGLSRYNKDTNRFTNYYVRDYLKELKEIGYHSLYDVFIDSKDRIWVGSSYHGALLFDKAQDKYIPVPQYSGATKDTLPQVYGDFREDGNGTIWAAAGPSGLFWYDEEEAIFRPATMATKDWDLIKSRDIFRIYADSENNIWIMTTTDVYKYYPSSHTVSHVLNYTIPNPINTGHEGQLLEDTEGNMLVAHTNMPYLVKFPNLSEKPVILKSKKLYATDILIDSFDIIWLSDWTQGLHKYVPSRQTFHQPVNGSDILWRDDKIDCIKQSAKNPDKIFIFSQNFGKPRLASFNQKSGQYSEYRTPDYKCYYMSSNPDGTFFMAAWDNGLIKWNPQTDQNTACFADSSVTPNLVNKSPTTLQKDGNGDLWIGTLHGLYKTDAEQKKLELIIPEYTITVIYFDDEILWLGTHGSGLLKYHLNTKNIEKFQFEKFTNSISSNIIWDIYRDKHGFLWLATEDGLNRFDLRTNTFKVFRESDGLQNDYIAGILPDKYGNLWLSNNSGISRMQKDQNNQISFSNYGAADGLMNPNFRHAIKLIDAHGRFFFGGNNGLYYFTPHEGKSKPPIPHLTDILVNGKSLNRLVNSKNNPNKLDLTYDKNTLAFEFIALHFAKPAQNKYAYYLEGLESDWIHTTKREVQYINLDPGLYTFHLRTANRDGIWSSEVISYSININDPWWNTWYAYLVYLCLAFGGLALIRQFELNRRKEIENKRILEAENRRKTKELEEARQLQLSMLPKELPRLPHFDIAVYIQTATEVGGDYYDFHVSMDGTLTVVIGDATGHGMKAGTMVTAAKSLFRSYGPNPDILFSFQEITRCIKEMNFGKLSMCLTMLKIKDKKLQMSAAGMPPSFIFRNDTKVMEEHLFKAMPLGTMEKFPYELKDTTLKPGDTILLMSDGLPELENAKGEMYGYKRIRNGFEDVAEKSPEEIISYLKNEGATWANNEDPEDDVTFVVIKVK